MFAIVSNSGMGYWKTTNLSLRTKLCLDRNEMKFEGIMSSFIKEVKFGEISIKSDTMSFQWKSYDDHGN